MVEKIRSMEPMLPDESGHLADLAFDLATKAAAFSAGFNTPLRCTIGDLVRSMNCYYSNLIEGHATRLIDIENALKGSYDAEPKKRDLQLEAAAHIAVQGMIDRREMPHPPLSIEGIAWIHEAFCDRLPDSLLMLDDPVTGGLLRLVGGQFRDRHAIVGQHVTPDPEHIQHHLHRFIDAYTSKMMSKTMRVISIGAAHHRLVWLHPFNDGNGRVSRLLAHAMLADQGIGSELWSVSRGLARSVGGYKRRLEEADWPRQGDRDGRGALSEAKLAAFCEFFLETAIDQVDFMSSLLSPGDLFQRIELWEIGEVSAKRLPKGSFKLLREVYLTGEVERGRAAEITGYNERQARTIMKSLLDRELLRSDTPRGSLRLHIPADVVESWLPGLYQPAI